MVHVILITSAFLIPSVAYVAEAGSNYGSAASGDFKKYTIVGGDSDDEYSIDLTVYNGSRADLYILSKAELDNYEEGLPFTTSFAEEDVTTVDDNWFKPDGGTYYIVIDNQDNIRSSDAEPTGNITFYVSYFNVTDVEEFFESIGDICGLGIFATGACCVLIIVIVIGIIVLLAKRNDKETVVIQAPPGGFPPQQPGYYPQQAAAPPMAPGTQPPQGGYYQQPQQTPPGQYVQPQQSYPQNYQTPPNQQVPQAPMSQQQPPEIPQPPNQPPRNPPSEPNY
jgi:hypothetical protein